MPQLVADEERVRARLSGVGPDGVPEVVYAAVDEPRPPADPPPCALERRAGEALADDPPAVLRGGDRPEQLDDVGADGVVPVPGLAVADAQLEPLEVDVAPSQVQDLGEPASGERE